MQRTDNETAIKKTTNVSLGLVILLVCAVVSVMSTLGVFWFDTNKGINTLTNSVSTVSTRIDSVDDRLEKLEKLPISVNQYATKVTVLEVQWQTYVNKQSELESRIKELERLSRQQ